MALNLVVVYNPIAGPEDVHDYVNQIVNFWQTKGWRVETRATEHPGHAASIAAEIAGSDADMVLVMGGDGTVGQVSTGLAGTNIVLAIIPIGTANVFAKLLHLTPTVALHQPDPIKVSEDIRAGNIHRIDLGKAFSTKYSESGYHFISWAGLGLSGHVIEQIEPRPKWIKQLTGRRFGWISYILLGVPRAVRYPGIRAQVRVDSQEINGTFVIALVTNSRLYGGGFVQLSQTGHLDDGKLDVWLFRGKVFRDTLGHVARLLTARHMMSASTIHLRGRRVLIRPTDEMQVELDGEPAGATPFYAHIDPLALDLAAPNSAPSDLFIHSGIPFTQWEVSR
ncbi:MAG: diacylglycerol kinase family protein [Chloroflexota bacterium]